MVLWGDKQKPSTSWGSSSQVARQAHNLEVVGSNPTPTTKTIYMDYLINWVFIFNPFTKLWNAVPRDKYLEFWSDHDHADVIKSSKIETLLALLQKTEGDGSKIHKVVKNNV